MTKHVTIVEDDPEVRSLLKRSLSTHGYRVTGLETGMGLDAALSSDPADILILDVGLPDIDGLTIAQQVRRHSDVGIIMLSGLGELADKVAGLEIGADDYVTKPFEPREMLARVRSVLRRGQSRGEAEQCVEVSHELFKFAGFILDATGQKLTDRDGQIISLTNGEFRLLDTLVRRPARVLSRDQLLTLCYSNDTPVFDRSIDVCVARLRKKLGDSHKPTIIKSVRNGGYMFGARVFRTVTSSAGELV